MPPFVNIEAIKREAVSEHRTSSRIRETNKPLNPKDLRLSEKIRQILEEYIRSGKKLPAELIKYGPSVVQNAFHIVKNRHGIIRPEIGIGGTGSAKIGPRPFDQAVLKGIERLASQKRMDPVIYLKELFRQTEEAEQRTSRIIVFYQIGKGEKAPSQATLASVNIILSMPDKSGKEEALACIGLKFDLFNFGLDLLYNQYQQQIERGLKAEEEKEAVRAVIVKRKIDELLTIIASLNKSPLPA